MWASISQEESVSQSVPRSLQVVNGTTSGTTVKSGGIERVWGTASGTTISFGGLEEVNPGGTAIGTTIFNGGFEVVLRAGIASGATVSSGGTERVFSGGTTIGTIVDTGGFEIVSSGGTASATTLRGGTLEVASGGSTGGPITFTNAGGDLQLDDSQHFPGLIAGFASPSGVTEEIDLRDIAFGRRTHATFREDRNHLSGTLTVTDGTHTANLTLLGQYSTAMFHLASDGHGETMITDPMVGSAGHAVLAAPA